jgi:RES domain-containing protein
MVYCSEHLSLGVLELLVHLSARNLPDDMTAYGIELDDELVRSLDQRSLDAVERSGWSRALTRDLGDRWLAEKRSLALAVPSVVVPRELNILIDPEHPDAGRLSVPHSERFVFDLRLRG